MSEFLILELQNYALPLDGSMELQLSVSLSWPSRDHLCFYTPPAGPSVFCTKKILELLGLIKTGLLKKMVAAVIDQEGMN